jgi:hypothetical protein
VRTDEMKTTLQDKVYSLCVFMGGLDYILTPTLTISFGRCRLMELLLRTSLMAGLPAEGQHPAFYLVLAPS